MVVLLLGSTLRDSEEITVTLVDDGHDTMKPIESKLFDP